MINVHPCLPNSIHAYHQGECMQGHFRTALLEEGSIKYLTEVSKHPAKLKPRDISHVHSNLI